MVVGLVAGVVLYVVHQYVSGPVVAWLAADTPTFRLASNSAPLGSNQMLALASGIVLGGFVEEQLYRGYVLVRLTERSRGDTIDRLAKNLTTLCIMLLLLGGHVSAQSHLASIRGTVLDPTGAVIEGAPYRLIAEDTNRERVGNSGPGGHFSLAELEPGIYRLEFELTGYRRSVSETTLAVNQ